MNDVRVIGISDRLGGEREFGQILTPQQCGGVAAFLVSLKDLLMTLGAAGLAQKRGWLPFQ
jgi:hypothetical protein